MNDNNILLKECIDALDTKKVLSFSESKAVFDNFQSQIEFTLYGRVNWRKYESKISIENNIDILTYLDKNDSCYFLWNDMNLPVIESNINNLLNKIDDVLAVSFDTWIWIEAKNIIIEFFHDSSITLLEIAPERQFDYEPYDI